MVAQLLIANAFKQPNKDKLQVTIVEILLEIMKNNKHKVLIVEVFLEVFS